jgi:hypothetical protein
MLPIVGRLVGRAEIEKMFGVGKTQAQNLTREPDFPAPFDVLTAGVFWLRTEVVAWGRAHGRTIYDEDDHTTDTEE